MADTLEPSISLHKCVCVAVSLQQVMHEQDRDLQKVHHSLHTLGQMGEEIGNELDDQNRLAYDHHQAHLSGIVYCIHAQQACSVVHSLSC